MVKSYPMLPTFALLLTITVYSYS